MSVSHLRGHADARTYRFQDFELDVDAHRLSLRGEPIHLERRPFALLVLLVSQAGRLVPREELISALWPGNVIIDFDSGLNTVVRKVRQALGDPSEQPVCIETVPGRGYRFIAPVREGTPRPPLRIVTDAVTRVPVRPRWRLGLLGVVGLVAAVGIALATWLPGNSPGGRATRIVVLPFENLTGSEALSYLASGLAEETSASLSRIDPEGFRVIGGVSAATLTRSSLSATEIGRRLGVDFVVRSMLQADRSRIRINSSLIRVSDAEQIWSASFDRELLDVLGLQRELSIAIAEQIRLRLSPEVAAQIDRRQTLNPEAYRLYLQGRYAWGQFTPTANGNALRLYEQAVRVDPDYALAWAGIAQALALAPMTTDADMHAVAAAARDAVRHAVDADPNLAEVMYAKAYVSLFVDWDARAAEAAARAAVQLDPNNAVSYMFLGVVLSQIGNHAEGASMLRRARELDPLFAQTFALSAMVANDSGDFRAGLELARQAIAISPEAWVAYLHLGNAQFGLGDYEAAIATYERAARLSNGNSKPVSARAYVLARTGHSKEARAVLAQLLAQSELEFVPPYAIAVVHAGLGEADEAFYWLERAMSVRDVHMLGLAIDPQWVDLRSDPRFRALTARLGNANG